MTCPHEEFTATVEVIRLVADAGTEWTGALAVDVTIECAECGEQVVFVGPVGLLRDRPTISVNGQELHAPARMASADPNTGMGLPGFVARVREGMPERDN